MSASGASGALADYRPELRPRVLLSDPLLDGAATVHLIKDTGSGNSFKVGPKEHFLIARMDGGRSLAEIGEEYAGEYGRRLADAHWQQILTMLGTKGLLAGVPAQPPPAPTAERPTLLRGTLPLVADADATTARLHRIFGFLLTPWAMGPLLVLMVAMEALVIAHSGDMLIAVRELFTNPVLLTGAAILLGEHRPPRTGPRSGGPALRRPGRGDRAAMAAAGRHHVLHGRQLPLSGRSLAPHRDCRGGRRDEPPLPAPLLRAVDLRPARRRHARGDLRAAAPRQLPGVRDARPLPPLDGYKIASQLAGATGLAASTGPYLRLALRRSPEAAAYPRRARIAYPAYALGTVLVLAALVAAAVAGVHHLLTA
ncbi:hypothetical protein SMICM17S_04806 [Streptomyces microflavus]